MYFNSVYKSQNCEKQGLINLYIHKAGSKFFRRGDENVLVWTPGSGEARSVCV